MSHKFGQQNFSNKLLAKPIVGTERFAQGDPMTKKEILLAIGSNLTLKDKKLCIEAKKPFFLLEESLNSDEHQNEPIEPENVRSPQRRKEANASIPPRGLGDLDDVRTYGYKASRAAALIYAHFKKEFGTPLER
jgi:hypothetical protein